MPSTSARRFDAAAIKGMSDGAQRGCPFIALNTHDAMLHCRREPTGPPVNHNTKSRLFCSVELGRQ
jgi:hypothetical protein